MTRWRTIPEWPEYEASDQGQVRRTETVDRDGRRAYRRTLNTYTRTGERLRPFVRMSRLDVARHVGVSVCVLSAFVSRRPFGKVPVHINGDVGDCRLANLRWGTMAHANLAVRKLDTERYPCGHRRIDANTYSTIRDRDGRLGGTCRTCHTAKTCTKALTGRTDRFARERRVYWRAMLADPEAVYMTKRRGWVRKRSGVPELQRRGIAVR